MDNQTEFHASEVESGCLKLEAGVHPTDETISNSLSLMSNVPTLSQIKRKFSETSDDECDDNKRQKIVEKVTNSPQVEKPISDDLKTDSPTFNEVNVETDKNKAVENSASAENGSEFQSFGDEEVKIKIVEKAEKAEDNHVSNTVCNTTEEIDVAVVNTNRTNEEESRLDVRYLYRLLRDGELGTDGIRAKFHFSDTSIVEHVAFGSHGTSSKYISTSTSILCVKDLVALKNSRKRFRTGCKTIIQIDVSSLPSNVQIIDLRTEEKRKQHIHGYYSRQALYRYHEYARKYCEVLLVGNIPRKCIQII